jgi:peptidoglycan/xylan/chitin deacetylase (PgdA/CDA1 family)
MKRNRHIKVLLYHRIIPQEVTGEIDFYAVQKQNFYHQLYLLDRLNFTSITFEDYELYLEGKLSLPRKPIILTFDCDYLDMVETALPILQQFDMKAVIFVTGKRELSDPLWNQNGDRKNTGNKLLSDKHMLELRAEGFEIGTYGMTYRNLAELNSAQIRREIRNSKQSVEAVLNEKIFCFAYPFGRVNDNLERLVEKYGFKFACGACSGRQNLVIIHMI